LPRSIHLKASELRLSALREKKQKALEDLNNETDKRTRKYLDDIEEEMESLTTKIAAFRQGSSA
jgi:predicted  nucleic acid-binding Zn-ribbon protein